MFQVPRVRQENGTKCEERLVKSQLSTGKEDSFPSSRLHSETRSKHITRSWAMQENQFEKEGHMRLARFRFLIVPVFFLFACVAAMAQQNSEIVGTVTDQTGAVVPGAILTLTQVETGFVYNAVSNDTGGY